MLQRAPQHQRQKADQDVGLRARLRVMKQRPEAQIVFADAEAVLDLRQADVGLPQLGRLAPRQVGAQQIAAVGLSGPIFGFSILALAL